MYKCALFNRILEKIYGIYLYPFEFYARNYIEAIKIVVFGSQIKTPDDHETKQQTINHRFTHL